MNPRTTLKALFTAALATLYPLEAYAYIDPVSGSFILQAVVSAVGMLLVALKLYYKKLKSWYSSEKDDNDNAKSNQSDGHDQQNS